MMSVILSFLPSLIAKFHFCHTLPLPRSGFRSDALTGPFASFKKAQLFETLYGAK